jgi:spore germination cell wall hydrolase CwlJ-like protein
MTTDAPPPAIVSYETKVATIAAVLLAETGGGWDSMCAVAQVIHNRGCDPYAVVTKPKQFSCLNRTTPAKLIRKWSTDIPVVTPESRQLAIRLLCTWKEVFSSDVGSATHYHSTKVKPAWSKGQRVIARIGGHLFYKLP